MTLLHAGDAVLPDEDVGAWIAGQLGGAGLEGCSVLLLVPDGTRTAPVPLVLDAVRRVVGARLTVLVALGTHQPMTEQALGALLGADVADLRAAGVEVLNHAWHDPAAFADLGTIGADEVAALSGGLLAEPVDVRVNRLVVESDVVLVAGPVFPHEVVGFSGGNKYLFPGVGGQEVIDLSHWLGALLTSYALIGTRGTTPVRALIDRAAALVPTRRLCLALVVQDGVRAVAFGSPEQAWAEAAEVSARVHVRYLDRPYQRVLALVPPMYPDMWTAAKGMYKLEPVVADGGTLVLYAPHVVDFSVTHGDVLAQVGYHVRDYFLGQWDRFSALPRGVLAHSTHLRGVGTWDAQTGEHPRIDVVLATGISADRCAAHGLGHLDPRAVDPELWARDPDTLVVPHAGELLHRLAAP
jgi:nickel-dependent lactate racemase